MAESVGVIGAGLVAMFMRSGIEGSK